MLNYLTFNIISLNLNFNRSVIEVICGFSQFTKECSSNFILRYYLRWFSKGRNIQRCNVFFSMPFVTVMNVLSMVIFLYQVDLLHDISHLGSILPYFSLLLLLVILQSHLIELLSQLLLFTSILHFLLPWFLFCRYYLSVLL